MNPFEVLRMRNPAPLVTYPTSDSEALFTASIPYNTFTTVAGALLVVQASASATIDLRFIGTFSPTSGIGTGSGEWKFRYRAYPGGGAWTESAVLGANDSTWNSTDSIWEGGEADDWDTILTTAGAAWEIEVQARGITASRDTAWNGTIFASVGFGTAPTLVGSPYTPLSSLTANSHAWPAGHALNDVGFLFIQTANQNVPATPTGTTAILTTLGGGSAGVAGASKMYCYAIRATGGAMAAISTGDSGDHQNSVFIVVRGLKTTGAVSTVVEALMYNNIASTTAVSMQPVSPQGSRRMYLLAVGMGGPDSNSTTAISGWTNAGIGALTEIADLLSNTGVGGGIAAAWGVKTKAGNLQTSTTATLATAARHDYAKLVLIPDA